MTFNAEQNEKLAAPLGRDVVKSRDQGGRTVSYVEGWHVIAEANRIFGFDGWTRETIDFACVADRPREIGRAKDPGFGVTYICRVRVDVGGVVREGCGAGHGIDRDQGQAHESALKEAETDAMKRALMTFGNPFGLALYDKAQANVADVPQEPTAREKFIAECNASIDRMANRPPDLLAWWNSQVQKQARRDFELDTMEVARLKARVMSLIPPKGQTDAE